MLIAAICGAIFLFNGKTQPTKSLAKQVEEDYTGIEDDRQHYGILPVLGMFILGGVIMVFVVPKIERIH